MGLIPTFCRFLIMAHKAAKFQGPVLTLGNQDVWASCDDLKGMFREQECSFCEPEIIPTESALFKNYPPLLGRARDFVHARTFFQMFGINEYWDLDVSDYENPRIVHDLNAAVPERLHSYFNLIVDSGTIEHVFDVRQVTENIIRMCRTSGWVVHITPASNFLDHGFYSFSPSFFYDLYAANGFDNFRCYILQHQPNPLIYFAACPYFEYSYGMDFADLIDPHLKTVVFFMARKATDMGTMAAPAQGSYATRNGSVTPSVSAHVSPSLASPTSRRTPGDAVRLLSARLFSMAHRARIMVFPRYRSLKKM